MVVEKSLRYSVLTSVQSVQYCCISIHRTNMLFILSNSISNLCTTKLKHSPFEILCTFVTLNIVSLYNALYLDNTLVIQGVQEKLCFFHNSLQPLPRLHRCKRPSKISTQCEWTVTPIGC